MTSLKLGLRNLARNRWRSGLTLAAVAVAVGLMVWTLALYEGWIAEMVRGATAVETAQVQVHAAAYIENRRVYETFHLDSGTLATIGSVQGVRALAPRVRVHGLIGNEQRSQVAALIGVDPEREAAATPIADAVVEGRWLSPAPPDYPAPREAVLGQGVAGQLRVRPGAELVVLLETADGSLGNDMLRVVGVVRTANTQVDRLAAYLHLSDLQYIAVLDDGVHELAIRTDDLDAARATADSIAAALGVRRSLPLGSGEGAGQALVVRPWQEILPEIDEMILLFRRSYWILYLLVYLVAAVGILNTQRMSALERRREFGVLLAIGMRPRRMFRTILVETLVLGLLGALLGAGGGFLLSWHHARAGLDLRLFSDQASFSYMGVAFSERLHFVLTAAIVVQPVVIMLAVALASGLWPALKAARMDPAPTIAGRM